MNFKESLFGQIQIFEWLFALKTIIIEDDLPQADTIKYGKYSKSLL